MNYDILVKIFTMVSTMDLILNISRVCPLWRAACSHPSFWRTLDLARLNCSSDYPQGLDASLDNRASLRLMQLLNSALILSGNNVTRLIFHFQMCIKDSHLTFAAERCPRLKQLVLPAWNQISENGFCAAIQKLTELESLTLPCNYFPENILQTIGVYCTKLTELKVMSPFDHDFANTLFIYLPKLKVLSLRCTMVHKDALRLAFMLFDDLKVLNISHSLLVDLFPYEIPTMFRLEDDASMAEQASRLTTFLSCQSTACVMCQRVYNDAGRPNWQEYQEGLWREDEGFWLAGVSGIGK
ncbi:F-box/LRR-repeat protein At3g48880-like [Mercurialis annua]|uniref:F-box/LRR-repeat protein At3g48880-like n=1 Tax=Mercurialis annua TaxID=3986 RepID=UPI00216052AE|nr:F-box/LRR-repeat protein At3g48880-like [Mercurialis annua]